KTGSVKATGNIQIKQELVLKNGILDISQHRLLMEENAKISTNNSFNENCMIKTSGNLGDGGITKKFSSEDLQSETWYFPLGTNDSFTGATIKNLTTFPTGKSITIFPVTGHHPSINDAFEDCDPTKVLQYYWGIETNMTNEDIFAGDIVFHYQSNDCAGDAQNYLTAQLRPMHDDSWAKFDAGINGEDQTLTFNHTEGVDNSILSGYYTAGKETAIPANVPRFIASENGEWENNNIWGSDIAPPSGVIVEIPEDVSVYISQDMKRVYKTIIKGHLTIEEGTTFHNLGFVEGNGTLEIKGTGIGNPINLPNGRYEDFIKPGSKSTIIFSGNAGILPANHLTYNNLVIAGTGSKIMPLAQSMIINGDLTIQKNAILQTAEDQTIKIAGDLMLETDAGLLSHASNTLFVLNGEQPQTISGNFTSQTSKNQNNSISRLHIQNPQNVILEGEGLEITDRLFIDDGILISKNSQLTLSSDAPGAMANYSKEHFIEGTLTRALPANSTENYVFPVAQNHKPRFITVNPENSNAGNWTAEFFDQETSDAGMDHANLEEGLAKITGTEYWSLEGPVNGKAYVSLHWGPETAVSLLDEHLNTLLVAEWNENEQQWVNRGMTNYDVTGNGYGAVTSNLVNFSKKYFSIGASQDNNPLPVELLEFNARANKKQVHINWKTATEINNSHFTVERSINGRDYEAIDVIDSKTENGNSNQVLSYEITDETPLEGKSYYRLKQTDFDGTTDYSDPVYVILNPRYEETFSVFPNPVAGQSFQVSLTGTKAYENIDIKIFDMYGKEVFSNQHTSDDNGNFMQTITTNQNFRSGIYIVSLHANSVKHSQKVVIK
ncbi:MAG: T9SS type A sorting domain-containing protein, partial [Bacteroidota bacterium]